jgi:hypothetical protein
MVQSEVRACRSARRDRGFDMLIVAAFLAIGGFALAFLLRFLFALQADARPASRIRQLEPVPRRHLHFSGSGSTPAIALYLARRNPNPAVAGARRDTPMLVAMHNLAEEQRRLRARGSDAARLRTS